MKTVCGLFQFLRPYWKDALLALLLGMAALCAAVGLLGVSADLLARASLRPSIAELQVAIVGVRFFGLSRAAFRYLERLASHRTNLKLLGRIRRWFFRILAGMPADKLETQTSADLLTRAVEDIETLDQFFVRALAPLLTAAVATAGMGIFLGNTAAVLGWILVLGMGTACVGIPFLTVKSLGRKERDGIALRARYHSLTHETIELADHWRLFDLTSTRMQQWEASSRAYASAQAAQRVISAAADAGTTWAAGMTGLAVLIAAGMLNREGLIPGTKIAVLAVLAMAVFEAASPLNAAAGWLRACIHAGERILAFQQEPRRPNSLEVQERETGIGPGKLRIDNIGYTYPGAQAPAVAGISLRLRAGEKLGITGLNGSGKSTLLRIAAGELLPQQGQVVWENSASQFAAGSFLAARPYIFSNSLADNLRLANPQASQEQIWQALSWVGLDRWARSLPEQLETWPGRLGWQISQGQRQRIGLARLFLADAPILFLDEPLANLDSAFRVKMRARLIEWSRDKTVLWVSHDLSELIALDTIVVLSAGKIAQQGSPDDLLRQDGWFARQFLAQQSLENTRFDPGD